MLVNKTIEKNHTVYNFFGIKLKISNLKLSKKIFINKNKEYNSKKHTVKRRLFMTTGNLNLLNNITIIKQLNEENTQDTLVVVSRLTNKNFEESVEIMSSLHKFEKKLYMYGQEVLNSKKLLEFFLENNLYDYDEIYFSNQGLYINVAKNLYPKSKWFMTDEGIPGRFAHSKRIYNKVEKLIMHNYLDGKFDSFGLNKKITSKFVDVDRNIFFQIIKMCTDKKPLNVRYNQADKIILLCGLFWENTGLSQEEYTDYQNDIIAKLINLGYTVWFKPHPRDNREYVNNKNVLVLDTALPIECYDFQNIVATISYFSSATLHLYCFQRIPCFQMPIKNNSETKSVIWSFVKRFLLEYTLPFDVLLGIDANKHSVEQIKEILEQKSSEYFNNKPKLSENEKLLDYAKEIGYEV